MSSFFIMEYFALNIFRLFSFRSLSRQEHLSNLQWRALALYRKLLLSSLFLLYLVFVFPSSHRLAIFVVVSLKERNWQKHSFVFLDANVCPWQKIYTYVGKCTQNEVIVYCLLSLHKDRKIFLHRMLYNTHWSVCMCISYCISEICFVFQIRKQSKMHQPRYRL